MLEQESGIEQFAHMEEFNNFYESICLNGADLKAEGGELIIKNIDRYTTEELQHIQKKADLEIAKAKDECLIPLWYLKIIEELRTRSEQN